MEKLASDLRFEIKNRESKINKLKLEYGNAKFEEDTMPTPLHRSNMSRNLLSQIKLKEAELQKIIKFYEERFGIIKEGVKK